MADFLNTQEKSMHYGKLIPNHLCRYSRVNFLLTPNQSHYVAISAQPVLKFLQSFGIKSPAVTSRFRQVVKDGFYRSFDLNLNIKKGNMVNLPY